VSLNISATGHAEGRFNFSYQYDRTSQLVCRDSADVAGLLHAPTTAVGDSDAAALTQCVFLKGYRVTVRERTMEKSDKIRLEPIEDSFPKAAYSRSHRPVVSDTGDSSDTLVVDRADVFSARTTSLERSITQLSAPSSDSLTSDLEPAPLQVSAEKVRCLFQRLLMFNRTGILRFGGTNFF
jgi:hypothetical protein